MLQDNLFEYLLRLGDDSLILAQRLMEWSSRAPTIEVDLSLANIGLDLLGQATLFLDLAAEVENNGRDSDRLAFHRDAQNFRNCLLVEQPNGDFAQTMARQWLFSTQSELLFDALSESSNEQIAEIAAKAIKETRYHAELAREWVIRLGDGTEESRQRMADGLDWQWRFVDEMFENDAIETDLISAGVAADRSVFRGSFDREIESGLRAAGLPPPQYPRAISGGRSGRHSEHLGHLLATMQFLPRAYPEARW